MLTRLEEFRIANKIRPGRLADKMGIARSQLVRMRKGTDTRRRMMTLARLAVSELLGRRVGIEELFDFDDL